MIIKDELHGNIEFNELEKRIIDTEEFQRLRRIKQLALTHLVYPGATHTRFEHSLGTAHLSGRICDKLELDEDTIQKIRLYALLHDIGHVAFSHESEKILHEFLGDHDLIGQKKILKSEVADVLGAQFDPKEIIEISNTSLGQLISSDLGSDRMDYLQRDARNTGVAYGIIDQDRIIQTLFLKDEIMGIKSNGLEAAESLLIARFLMFSTVYMHHTVRIASAMLQKSITLAMNDDDLSAEDFLQFSDEDILNKLLKSTNSTSREYSDRLLKRDLLKIAYSCPYDENIENNIEELREQLPETLIDFPSPFAKPTTIMVDLRGELKPLEELSDIVHSLKSVEQRRKILVICEADDRKKINKQAEEVFSSYFDKNSN